MQCGKNFEVFIGSKMKELVDFDQNLNDSSFPGNLTIGDNGPPPLFKSVRSDEYAWNAIFSKNTWYGDLKNDVYTIYRRYIGSDGGYMDDIYSGYMPPPLFSKVCTFPDMHEMLYFRKTLTFLHIPFSGPHTNCLIIYPQYIHISPIYRPYSPQHNLYISYISYTHHFWGPRTKCFSKI